MRSASEAMQREVRINETFAAMDRLIVKEFGERCPDFDPTCATCVAWRAREDLHYLMTR